MMLPRSNRCNTLSPFPTLTSSTCYFLAPRLPRPICYRKSFLCHWYSETVSKKFNSRNIFSRYTIGFVRAWKVRQPQLSFRWHRAISLICYRSHISRRFILYQIVRSVSRILAAVAINSSITDIIQRRSSRTGRHLSPYVRFNYIYHCACARTYPGRYVQ